MKPDSAIPGLLALLALLAAALALALICSH
jgi:hypothetical protein